MCVCLTSGHVAVKVKNGYTSLISGGLAVEVINTCIFLKCIFVRLDETLQERYQEEKTGVKWGLLFRIRIHLLLNRARH